MPRQGFRFGELVWFMWRGFLCVSPVLRVNRTTVKVVTADGERCISKIRVSHQADGARKAVAS